MDRDWIVKIEYKNKDMETVVEKEYPFAQYVEMIANELTSVITDVENAFYYFEDGEQKKDWSPESQKRFKDIRHKLLDHANSVRRLYQTLRHNGVSANTINMSEAIADAFNQGLIE